MRGLFNALQAGNRSGTGEYSYQCARWLPGLAGRDEIIVLWPKDVDPPEALGHTDAVDLHDVSSPWRRVWLDQARVPELARQYRAELVHYPASIAGQWGRARTIVTIHDLAFLRNPAWFRADRAAFYRLTIGRSARRAARIIADSAATKTDLVEYLRIPEERIDVVHLGVSEVFAPRSAEEQSSVKTRYGLPKPYFLYYGTLEPRKNLAQLIDAWSCVSGDISEDLVIVGRRGWKTEEIDLAIQRCSHRARIRMLGFVSQEDLPALISGARALVWPSLWEGFGLPPLESMACGTPVLTSAVSSLPEICGDAALLVDPTSVVEIADGISRLASDDALCADLRGRGLARVQEYTWERTARGLLDSYRRAF